MTEHADEPKVTSLEVVIQQWERTHDQYADAHADLMAALYAREDNMREVLQLAGVQFGLFPQIVAEVLAEVGLGSPMSSEQRDLIRSNFTALMEQLAQQHGLGE